MGRVLTSRNKQFVPAFRLYFYYALCFTMETLKEDTGLNANKRCGDFDNLGLLWDSIFVKGLIKYHIVLKI